MSTPRVSILMTGFNVSATLERTLRSLEAQTFTDWELIYVDDQSQDQTRAVFESFVRSHARDPQRYRWVDTPSRMGFVGSLNYAFSLARGAYLARMDADDECDPRRLELQVGALDEEPSLGMVGSQCWVQFEGHKSRHASPRPQTDAQIRQGMAYVNPFVHGAVVLRRSVLDQVGMYRADFTPQTGGCEDYELWLRVLEVSQGLNLPEYLYIRHELESGLTRKGRPWLHMKRHFWIATQAVRRLGLSRLAYLRVIVPVVGILVFALFRVNKERGHSWVARRSSV